MHTRRDLAQREQLGRDSSHCFPCQWHVLYATGVPQRVRLMTYLNPASFAGLACRRWHSESLDHDADA